MKLDQGQVDNAKVQLGYCRIIAPIPGRVGLRLVDAGNIVHASDANPLVVITELQPITVVFSVAEDYLPQIQQQLRAGNKLAVDAFDRAQIKKIATGTLQALDNQIDTSTGTIKLKAMFANAHHSLWPGQFVNARLKLGTDTNVIAVAAPAVQHGPDGLYVYTVAANNTVAVQPIKVERQEGDVYEVSSGLAAGTVVVATGQSRLQAGAPVTIRDAETTPTKSGS